MHRRVAHALLACWLTVGLTVAPVAASAAELATKSCANRDLPAAILAGAPAEHPTHPLRTIDVAAPHAALVLAVADDDGQRELGLMCVTGLRVRAGMLFAFAASARWEFWMKRTLIPLDMLWLDSQGRVTAIAAGVPASTVDEADDKVARRSGSGRYVVELNGGEAHNDGIVVGTRLSLPNIDAR